MVEHGRRMVDKIIKELSCKAKMDEFIMTMRK
jgi:hypothetical protein